MVEMLISIKYYTIYYIYIYLYRINTYMNDLLFVENKNFKAYRIDSKSQIYVSILSKKAFFMILIRFCQKCNHRIDFEYP